MDAEVDKIVSTILKQMEGQVALAVRVALLTRDASLSERRRTSSTQTEAVQVSALRGTESLPKPTSSSSSSQTETAQEVATSLKRQRVRSGSTRPFKIKSTPRREPHPPSSFSGEPPPQSRPIESGPSRPTSSTRTVPPATVRGQKMTEERREYTAYLRNTVTRYNLCSRMGPPFFDAVNEVIRELNFCSDATTKRLIRQDLGECLDNRRRYYRSRRRMKALLANRARQMGNADEAERERLGERAIDQERIDEDDMGEEEELYQDEEEGGWEKVETQEWDEEQDGREQERAEKRERANEHETPGKRERMETEDDNLKKEPAQHEEATVKTQPTGEADICYNIGQFFAVLYDKEWYPAQLLDTTSSGTGASHYMNLMERRGPNSFIWPDRKINFWVREEQIITNLSDIYPAGDGLFKLNPEEHQYVDRLKRDLHDEAIPIKIRAAVESSLTH